MSNICVKLFLMFFVVAVASVTPAGAYSYEDYLPPDAVTPDQPVSPPPPASTPAYSAYSGQPAYSGGVEPAIRAPAAHLGAAPSQNSGAQSAVSYTGQSPVSPASASADPASSAQDPAENDKTAEESHRQGGDWYIATSIGVTQRPSATAAGVFSPVGPGTERINFQAGPTATLAAGYRVTPYFRLEGELDYSQYDIKDLRPNVPGLTAVNGSTFKSISGNPLYRGAFLLNGYFDLPGYGPLVPYVGGGLGVARLFGTTNLSQNAFGSIGLVTEIGRYNTGVAMLEAGFDVILSDHWSIAPSYRYLHYFSDDDIYGDETAQIFKMNARYSF